MRAFQELFRSSGASFLAPVGRGERGDMAPGEVLPEMRCARFCMLPERSFWSLAVRRGGS